MVTPAAGTEPIIDIPLINYLLLFKSDRHSALSGRFLVPFARQDAGTFTLSICDANRAPLRAWKCAVADFAEGETRLCYSVNRNHFYSFGFKPSATDTEADRPIDLSASAEIEVTVLVEPLITDETEIPVH